MSHYVAINIGPIGLTLSLARKPREFWQASYLFSHLMKRLLEGFCQDQDKDKNKDIRPTILSPKVEEEDPNVSYKTKAGIYPDRAFFKLEQPIDDEWIKKLVEIGLDRFAKDIRFGEDVEYTKNIVRDYFNVMTASCESASDCEAIKQLNEWLNYLELSAHAPQPGTVDEISQLLQKEFDSPLFLLAFGERRFKVETLEEIAEYECRKFGVPRKTYHNYICIVQADGDNMGKVVTHLPDGKLADVSNELTAFGKTACATIAEYGGMPIYAGGDDLLFIAPVWGGKEKPQSVFDLIETLDTSYTGTVGKIVENIQKEIGLNDDDGHLITTSMSFGLSITYVKYPLYEAWQYASSQLFGKAKQNWGQKHAIAWKLQKHSGSGFAGDFSYEHTALYQAFKTLIDIPAPENMVSAVAHKLRGNQDLLSLFQDKSGEEYNSRLNAFFKKIVDEEGKNNAALCYFEQVKTLLKELKTVLPEKKTALAKNETITDRMVGTAYSMLRTAKFFNGEEEKL